MLSPTVDIVLLSDDCALGLSIVPLHIAYLGPALVQWGPPRTAQSRELRHCRAEVATRLTRVVSATPKDVEKYDKFPKGLS